jgi:hypothetical protein
LYTGAVLALLVTLHAAVDGTHTHSNSTSHMKEDWTCPMYGIDNYGDNLEVIENVGSWEDCGFLCLQRGDCALWVWVHERAGRQCYLKANFSDKEEWDAATVAGARGCFTRC